MTKFACISSITITKQSLKMDKMEMEKKWKKVQIGFVGNLEIYYLC